jgi:hypothetical protein
MESCLIGTIAAECGCREEAGIPLFGAVAALQTVGICRI